MHLVSSCSISLLVLVLFCFGVSFGEAGPNRPVRPQKYMLWGEMIVRGLDGGLPLMVAVDKEDGNEFISFHRNNMYCRIGWDKVYFTHPALNQLRCFSYSCNSSLEPLCNRYIEIIPDVTEDWSYMGSFQDELFNVIDIWTFKSKYSFHTYYVSRAGIPVMHTINGYNDIFSSHPDLYIIHFHRFVRVVHHSFFAGCACNSSNDVDLRPGLETRIGYFASRLLGLFSGSVSGVNLDAGSAESTNHDATNDPASTAAFIKYTEEHGRTYSENEIKYRFKNFVNSKRLVEKHNNVSNERGFELEINKFSDMSFEELQKYTLLKIFNDPVRRYPYSMHFKNAVSLHKKALSRMSYPQSVNWVDAGVVNKPKDQGICGSCWAFGTTGALESHIAIKTQKLLSLSEQVLLDCSWDENGNQGCDGGLPDLAYKWMTRNNVFLEETYKYAMVDGFCQKPNNIYPIVVNGYVSVQGGEDYLLDALVHAGPLSVTMSVYEDLVYYKGGIYESEKCRNTKPDDLNHVVMLVGYGTEERNGKKVDYWLLRNSWGEIWGENGYFKLARGTVGAENGCICGICYDAGYPVVDVVST